MIKISKTELNFLPDETGRKCIIPDLTNTFSQDLLKTHDFLFFVIRQLNDTGEPTGLYLKDVSSLRTPEQNAMSKYKFQSLKTFENPLKTDGLLVRLKPKDKLDLPDYSKNQKEYTCFENLSNGKAELVAVFEKKPATLNITPDLFKINFNKNNGENIVIVPIVSSSGELFYETAQIELNEKIEKLSFNDFSTQYLFNGNKLICSIPTKNYKNNISIIQKTITDMNYTYEFFFEVVDNEIINEMLKGKMFKVSKVKGEKIHKKLTQKTFTVDYDSGSSQLSFNLEKLYLDKECKIPLTNKYNFSPKFNFIKFYIKTEDINLTKHKKQVKQRIYSTSGEYISVTFNSENNYSVDVSEIERKFSEKTKHKFVSFEVVDKRTKNKSTSLSLEQSVNKSYAITYSSKRSVVIDGHRLEFDYKGIGYCADVTSIIEQQKTQNSVWHYFVYGNPNGTRYGVDYKHILEVVQYDENTIYLRLVRDGHNPANVDNFENYIQHIGKRKYTDNSIAIHITRDKYIYEHRHWRSRTEKIYTIPCTIKAIFGGVERFFDEKPQQKANYISWYACVLDLTEIQKTYPKITRSYVEEQIATCSFDRSGQTSMCVTYPEYIDGFCPGETLNKPNYRNRFCKMGENFYIPKDIYDSFYNDYYKDPINCKKVQLAFTSIEDTKKWQLIFYKYGNS